MCIHLLSSLVIKSSVPTEIDTDYKLTGEPCSMLYKPKFETTKLEPPSP